MSGSGSWARVEGWFLGPIPVHVMVVNRCVLGGVLFLDAASRVPEFGLLYGSASAVWSPAHAAFVSRFMAPDLSGALVGAASFLGELAPDTRQVLVVGLYAGLLASSLAFALGLFTRIAGCAAVALHLFFVSLHPLAHYGWASMIVPFAFYGILSRAGDYASIDAWSRRRRGHAPPPGFLVPAWPMRLLQVHVAAMYFYTGFARIDDLDWLRGEVLFEALTRAIFTRFSFDLHVWKPALLLLSYSVFLLEPLAAIVLWIPRLRSVCALLLIAMHLVLELLTNVGWWNYMMIAGLLSFLPAAWLIRLLPRISTPGSTAVETRPLPP